MPQQLFIHKATIFHQPFTIQQMVLESRSGMQMQVTLPQSTEMQLETIQADLGNQTLPISQHFIPTNTQTGLMSLLMVMLWVGQAMPPTSQEFTQMLQNITQV